MHLTISTVIELFPELYKKKINGLQSVNFKMNNDNNLHIDMYKVDLDMNPLQSSMTYMFIACLIKGLVMSNLC